MLNSHRVSFYETLCIIIKNSDWTDLTIKNGMIRPVAPFIVNSPVVNGPEYLISARYLVLGKDHSCISLDIATI
jgi:hypothetical protein